MLTRLTWMRTVYMSVFGVLLEYVTLLLPNAQVSIPLFCYYHYIEQKHTNQHNIYNTLSIRYVTYRTA